MAHVATPFVFSEGMLIDERGFWGLKMRMLMTLAGAATFLTNPNIQAELRQARRAFQKQCSVKYQHTLNEWGKIAFSDLGQILDFT